MRTRYVKDEITELLDAPEGDYCEFKEAKTRYDFEEAVKYCCAIANCGGGKLILGITNDRPREVVGSEAFSQPERTREKLMDRINVRVDFSLLYDSDNKRILVFEVASRPIGLPVHADGIPWWRKGDSLVKMPPEVLHRIYEESGHDFSADICVGAKLHDLDIDAVNDFRKRWLEKSGNKKITNMSVEQLLSDCGAITDDGVTNAALILFGTRKALNKHLSQAEVSFEYRSSEAAGPAQQREDFRVGFFTYYDKIWELVDLRNDKQNYQDGLFVLDVLTFNERVIRETLLNAACHRNYQLGGTIFVKQYRERIVFESPGGLPTGISPDNIIHKQYRRNRLIADILALSGLIERSGQGMDLIYELSIREGKPLPDFTGSDNYFVFITLNGKILDKRLILLFRRIEEEILESFTTDDFLVIDALFYEREVSTVLRSRLKALSNKGVVVHTGHGKYVLSKSLFEAVGKSDIISQKSKEERNAAKELLLKHIKQYKSKGTSFKEMHQILPGFGRGQVQVMLRELRKDLLIYTMGEKSAAKWFYGKAPE